MLCAVCCVVNDVSCPTPRVLVPRCLCLCVCVSVSVPHTCLLASDSVHDPVDSNMRYEDCAYYECAYYECAYYECAYYECAYYECAYYECAYYAYCAYCASASPDCPLASRVVSSYCLRGSYR